MAKPKATSSLSQQLIKVRLSQGFPTFEVKDDITNREVSSDKGSKADATKFIVKLVNGSESYKRAQYLKGQLYLYYLSVTSPWEDRGARMMLGAHALETMEELRQMRIEAEQAADTFCTEEYPDIYEKAVFQSGMGGNGLGTLASRVIDKYPLPSDVRSKFYNSIIVEPMGEVETLRRFGEVFTEQDLSEYESMLDARMQQAQTDAWKKLAEPLDALIKKCASATDKNVWHESLIQNVRDIVCLVDRINVQNDPTLKALAVDAVQMLNGVDKDTLKFDDVVRSETRAKAEALMARMSGYM